MCACVCARLSHQASAVGQQNDSTYVDVGSHRNRRIRAIDDGEAVHRAFTTITENCPSSHNSRFSGVKGDLFATDVVISYNEVDHENFQPNVVISK